MCTVVFDSRESKLIQGWDQEYRSSNLEIGDVHIQGENGDTIAVFERKTVPDLASSIKDGRWKEQKCRLLNARTARNFTVVYIIEGSNFSYNEDGFLYGISAKSLITAVMNAMFRDNIHVVMTRNTSESVQFIKAFAKRISDTKNDWFDSTNKTPTVDHHQEAIIKAKKKENVTRDTVFIMQLCAIPGISVRKATCIQKELGVNSMSEMLQKLPSYEEGVARLRAIKGIGSVLANEVLEQLGIGKID